MTNARTMPGADMWQRLIPPDDRAEGGLASRHGYGRLAGVVAVVLAVHGLVAGGLLFWPHEQPAGSAQATIAMVFEPPAPPAPRPVPVSEQNTQQTDTQPQMVPPPAAMQEESDLPSASLPRKLSVAHQQITVAPTTSLTARSIPLQAAPVLSRPPETAQPEGAEKLSCSPVHARYPAMARQLQEEGEAMVQVVLDVGGQVVEAHLIRSTGYDDLDEQAVLTARSMRCTPPTHPPLTGRIPVTFHIQ
ncbi:MAG: TonB family protein [Acetobacter papayae]|uniref:energy transducer TonB n=1 Tax=Acetobacter papayae TaxID=1076592 RepID=UPI0039E8DFD7